MSPGLSETNKTYLKDNTPVIYFKYRLTEYIIMNCHWFSMIVRF